jgi:hypothetical protein
VAALNFVSRPARLLPARRVEIASKAQPFVFGRNKHSLKFAALGG